MESMSPHDTFSLESFILNFQILAPKCSALSYKLRGLAHEKEDQI